jgi:hypothetical protein
MVVDVDEAGHYPLRGCIDDPRLDETWVALGLHRVDDLLDNAAIDDDAFASGNITSGGVEQGTAFNYQLHSHTSLSGIPVDRELEMSGGTTVDGNALPVEITEGIGWEQRTERPELVGVA